MKLDDLYKYVSKEEYDEKYLVLDFDADELECDDEELDEILLPTLRIKCF